MVRIGILMDALQGSIPSSFREKISDFVRRLPEIAFCLEEENLGSSDALNRIRKHLETAESDGIVIVGGSPRLYEASFQKLRPGLAINPYRCAVANIREQALWWTSDEGVALERAKVLISKAIRALLNAKPIEAQSLPLKPEVLILGGGMTGISIAEELAHSGIHVFLLEKGTRLGGRTLELHRFYNRLVDVQKWVDEKISGVKNNPRITLFTRSKLKHLEGHLGRFQARIQGPDRTETDLSVSAIVVATGYSATRDTNGIYGHRRVTILQEVEKLLSDTGTPPLLWDGKKVEVVTYLLDEVNQDMKVDSINAVKQALLLQGSFHCQVAILCKDVKVAADGMERLYRKARERGVLFFKYEEPPKLSMVNGHIQVRVKDTAAIKKTDQWPVSILSDLVVVSEAFVPTPETESLSGLLKIHLGTRGFLMEDNPQLLRVRSNRRGIFVAGACRFPQEVSESLIEARAAAEEVITFLLKGTYTYDLAVAEVDPKKCAVCYTCPRLCPHSAITVEKYGEKNVYAAPGTGGDIKWGAAKVDPAACYGCGICVAECPAKAITLQHLTDAQIYVQMNLPEG
jgi:heterodisulfide reductase subunit A-like polyferredoxin